MKGRLWNSPPIPDDLVDQEEYPFEVWAKAQELAASDEPSPSDIRYILGRYNEGTPEERDAMDAALVWFTGYTLASIAAMVVAGGSKGYEAVLKQWREASTDPGGQN